MSMFFLCSWIKTLVSSFIEEEILQMSLREKIFADVFAICFFIVKCTLDIIFKSVYMKTFSLTWSIYLECPFDVFRHSVPRIVLSKPYKFNMSNVVIFIFLYEQRHLPQSCWFWNDEYLINTKNILKDCQ